MRIDGTPYNDTLFGTEEDDMIYGYEGDDILYGEEGNDLLYGNQGDDTLFGSYGNDTLYGGQGNDLLFGDMHMEAPISSFNDIIYGNDGRDTILGGFGDDSIYGGQGHDLILGNLGNDQLFGNLGNDTLIGGPGIDSLEGGEGADTYVFSVTGYGEGWLNHEIDVISQGFDTDKIIGFNAAEDKIAINGIHPNNVHVEEITILGQVNNLENVYLFSHLNEVKILTVDSGALTGNTYLIYNAEGVEGVIQLVEMTGTLTEKNFVDITSII